MTDDRLYPPAAEYLTGVLARSHRQPRVDGLEGYVWFDVPHPDGTTYMLPVPEDLLKPAMPPEPEPGAYLLDGVMAVRFGADDSVKRWAVVTPGYVGGFSWFSWETLMQRHPDPQIVPLVPAQSTVDAPPQWEREFLDRQAAQEALDGPIPFPGEQVATRLPGGGWVYSGKNRFLRFLPKVDLVAERSDWCAENVKGSFGYICSVDRRAEHPTTPDGKRWHIATTEEGWVVAVWPSSVVAVQQPGGGAS